MGNPRTIPRIHPLLSLHLGFLLIVCGHRAPGQWIPPHPQWANLLITNRQTLNLSVAGLHQPGQTLPKQYSCDDRGTMPTVSWQGTCPNVKEFWLLIYDPDAPTGTFIHLAATGIPPELTQLNHTTLQTEHQTIHILPNSAYEPRWFPLCPPRGDRPHRYYFLVIGLNQTIRPQPASWKTMHQLIQKEHIACWGWTMGTYVRP